MAMNIARRSFFIGTAALFAPKVPMALVAPPRTATTFWVSLQTAVGEATFGGYTRCVGRLIEGDIDHPSHFDFPACSGGRDVITSFALHADQHARMFYGGLVTPEIHMGVGVTARLVLAISQSDAEFIAEKIRSLMGRGSAR